MSVSERSRSRSPLRGSDGETPTNRYLFVGNIPKRWYHMDVRNLLMQKTSMVPNLKIMEKIRHVFMFKDDNGVSKGQALVEFFNEKNCQVAYTALQDVKIEGKQLETKIDSGSLRPAQKSKLRLKKFQEERIALRPPKPHQKFSDGNHETYGLDASFLDHLGITPPLVNQLYITNLSPEVTETKLREVFSYAGVVVAAAIIAKKPSQPWGKVMYEHPVEAVQAISMFHNQSLYGVKMSVMLERKAAGVMPSDLGGIGMGLGPNGEPLRGIHTTLQIQPLKQLILKELSKIPDLINRQTQQNPMDSNQQNLMSMLSVNTNMNHNNPIGALMQLLQEKMGENVASHTWNTMQQGNNHNFNQNAFGNNQSQQTPPTSRFDIPPSGLTQNPPGNYNAFANVGQNPFANLQNAMVTGPTMANLNALSNQAPQSRFDVPPSGINIQNAAASTSSASNQIWGPGQNDWGNASTQSQSNSKGNHDNNSGSYGSSQHNPDEFDVQRLSDLNKMDANNTMNSSDMLLFQNLPASVTSKALINKMRELGELKFAEITGQGRAVVRFHDVRDAERCVKLYDRSKVDGQVISVKLF